MYLGYQNGKIVCVGDTERFVRSIRGVNIDSVAYTSSVYVLQNGSYVKEEEANKKTIELEKQKKIKKLKDLLSSTDYVVIKISEGISTKEEYKDVLENRKLWREELNALEVF